MSAFANTVPTEAWWLACDGSELHRAPVVGWQECRTYYGVYDPIVLSERSAEYIEAGHVLLLPAGERPLPADFARLLAIVVEAAEEEVADSVLLQLVSEYAGRSVHLAELAAATGRTLAGAKAEFVTLGEALATARRLVVEVDGQGMVTVTELPPGRCSSDYALAVATLGRSLDCVVRS